MTEVLHDIDIKLLRIFHTVAKYRSFSLAAENLNTSLSNISNNMAQLESRLEMRLCERGVKGFKLTEQGQRVLDASKALHEAMRIYHAQVMSVALDTPREFRIGILSETSFDSNFRIVEILSDLESTLPGIYFHLEFAQADKLRQLVGSNEIQCAFGYFDNPNKNFDLRYLYTEIHRCYCSVTHKFVDDLFAGTNMNTLQEQRIAGYDDLAENEKCEIPLFVKYNSCSRTSEGIMALILTGNYIGMVPEHYAQNWIDRKQIKNIFREKLALHVDISLLYRKSRTYEPVLTAILDSVRKFYPIQHE